MYQARYNKAEREKLKREHLNELFLELDGALGRAEDPNFAKVGGDQEVPANMFRSSFRDGLRKSVSHLPILTDSIILILVLSSLAEVSGLESAQRALVSAHSDHVINQLFPLGFKYEHRARGYVHPGSFPAGCFLSCGLRSETLGYVTSSGNAEKLDTMDLSNLTGREISTTEPKYYKWTQWIFLQLLKKGLAYQAEVLVNWCPALGTVLANEEVVDGVSELGGHPVIRKRITIPEILEYNWFMKGYKPPHFEQDEDVSLDDVDAVFNESKGFVRRETSFASLCPANEIMSKIEETAKPMGFNVHKRNYKMKLQGDKTGRNSDLAVATEVFEVAPSPHMVELRKTGGDTLEFHKVYFVLVLLMEEVPANMFRSSFRDGLRDSVSHLPILTNFIILILVLSSLAEFLANYLPSTDLLILYRLAVCSGIANSFLSFRHSELITIFCAMVRPTLGELLAYGYHVPGSVML
ncbi:CBL-interacting serine/threonine-protein kinase 9 isoform X2 [Tanacetum coccineum]